MRNFATIVNMLQSSYEGRHSYIKDLCHNYGLLVIDDLGAERDSEYMYEIVFNVIDTRINTGLPLIVTTNLNGDNFRNPKGIWERRIYDRLLGSCHPTEIKGKSMRRQQLNDGFEEMQQMLMKEI